MSGSSRSAELRGAELDGLRRLAAEIAVPDPSRPGADIGDVRPRLALAPVGKRLEVEPLQTLELGSSRLVRDAFVLDRPLVAGRDAADHQRDARIAAKVVGLPARA